jgi:flagellar M-ring protein FliF
VGNLTAIWAGLDLRRRVIVGLATIAMFAAVLGLARGGGPTQALLYAGLDPAAAGEVLAALDQRGITAEVRGDAIYVPETDRDALRLSLAAEGLPQSGTDGYELLDSLTGFGTTAQMFDAAYWRAKEGELARTIQSVPGVRAARVHISVPADGPFRRDRATPATAAVTVTMAAGAMSEDQARALRHLVSSAVAGLLAENVAIIDAATGRMVGAEDEADQAGRADDLSARAERLLSARVGPGNAIVEVAIDAVTETEVLTERRVDPESRVAVATDVAETTATSSESGGEPSVTVASNLPDGDGAAGGSAQSEESETRTTTSFDISETSREVVREPGAIRRMTVAVLVNDVITVSADGAQTVTPRTEEELQSLSDLVASAVGLDPARGDVITIRSMAFDMMAPEGTPAAAAPLALPPLDLMALIQMGVLALVVLILGLFVVRPILASRRALPPAEGALPPPEPMGAALAGPPGDGGLMLPGAGELPTFDIDQATGIEEAEMVDPVTRLRRLIAERQDESLQILQAWVEEPDGRERA